MQEEEKRAQPWSPAQQAVHPRKPCARVHSHGAHPQRVRHISSHAHAEASTHLRGDSQQAVPAGARAQGSSLGSHALPAARRCCCSRRRCRLALLAGQSDLYAWAGRHLPEQSAGLSDKGRGCQRPGSACTPPAQPPRPAPLHPPWRRPARAPRTLAAWAGHACRLLCLSGTALPRRAPAAAPGRPA